MKILRKKNYEENDSNRGVLDHNYVKTFILGGKAIFTLESTKSNKHYTFFVKLMDTDEQGNKHYSVYFQYKYGYWALCAELYYGPTRKECNLPSDTDFRGIYQYFFWVYSHYIYTSAHNPGMVFYHEGRCPYCGRRMTDPTSIKVGIGPKCRATLGIGEVA